MFKIINKNILAKKTAYKTFLSIYGISQSTMKKICFFLGIKLTFDIRKLKSDILIIELLHSFFKFIELLVETNLRRLEKIQLSKLMSTKCYRSQRFKLGLPSYGQRTHSNSKSARKVNVRMLFQSKKVS